MDATLMETLQSRLNLKQIERDQKRVGFIYIQISPRFRSETSANDDVPRFLFFVLSKLKHVTGVCT